MCIYTNTHMHTHTIFLSNLPFHHGTGKSLYWTITCLWPAFVDGVRTLPLNFKCPMWFKERLFSVIFSTLRLSLLPLLRKDGWIIRVALQGYRTYCLLASACCGMHVGISDLRDFWGHTGPRGTAWRILPVWCRPMRQSSLMGAEGFPSIQGHRIPMLRKAHSQKGNGEI